ncbi:hypothetical protein DSM19430T_24100 [Desulfovibrio psychrotolerans]|uniref:Toxin n=2 Tax=Desulfovibrio psychrotolerans TaxID=415242 RepID=A0A7J0BVI2_9BACT|nr:hypothetical protein DSM19430T_24100 [Desulfovibrio psychrotolerans]
MALAVVGIPASVNIRVNSFSVSLLITALPVDGVTFCSYISPMRFDWDDTKRRANVAKHDIDFTLAAEMLQCAPHLVRDSRKEYGEDRCQAVGEQDGMVLVVVFTMRDDNVFRIISARRANARERRKYGYEEK